MIDINRLFKNNRLMKAVTGLSIEGFNALVGKFSQTLQEIKQQKYEKGLKAGTRTRQPGGGAKGQLGTIELKLLFILMYFKCYSTMDLMGLFFNLDRSNIKRNIDHLTIVLESTLGKTFSLPKRKISSLDEFLELIPDAKDLFVDGTERPIQRPKDKDRQKKHYSGKKKGHTTKNLVLK